jgi:hypothetical protein
VSAIKRNLLNQEANIINICNAIDNGTHCVVPNDELENIFNDLPQRERTEWVAGMCKLLRSKINMS